jgi:hypothetical protein
MLASYLEIKSLSFEKPERIQCTSVDCVAFLIYVSSCRNKRIKNVLKFVYSQPFLSSRCAVYLQHTGKWLGVHIYYNLTEYKLLSTHLNYNALP